MRETGVEIGVEVEVPASVPVVCASGGAAAVVGMPVPEERVAFAAVSPVVLLRLDWHDRGLRPGRAGFRVLVAVAGVGVIEAAPGDLPWLSRSGRRTGRAGTCFRDQGVPVPIWGAAWRCCAGGGPRMATRRPCGWSTSGLRRGCPRDRSGAATTPELVAEVSFPRTDVRLR